MNRPSDDLCGVPLPDTLGERLDANYREHAAFRFDQPALELPADEVERFDRLHATLSRLGPLLSPRAAANLSRDAADALERVFASLMRQVADPLESAFLRELQSECTRLAREEADWHVRPPALGRLALTGDPQGTAAIRFSSARYAFGKLPDETVDELRRIAAPEVARFESAAAAGRLRRTDLSVNRGSTVRALVRSLNRAFHPLGVLDVVSAYVGRPMRVEGLALELSVAAADWWTHKLGDTPAPRTLYAHFDEAIAYPKAIVYLTDVAEDQGPTGCYPGVWESLALTPLKEIVGRVVGNVGSMPGTLLAEHYAKAYHQSMTSEGFRRHFMRLPPALRYNSHFGWDVHPGSVLEDRLAAAERKLSGPAGSFIVFDGARLLHRGGLIRRDRRVALQVVFSDVSRVRRAIGRARRMVGWA